MHWIASLLPEHDRPAPTAACGAQDGTLTALCRPGTARQPGVTCPACVQLLPVASPTEPCWLCGHPVHGGANVHPCCDRHRAVMLDGGRCPGCAASAGLNNARQRKSDHVPWMDPVPGWPKPEHEHQQPSPHRKAG